MTPEELKQITKQREKRTIEYKEAWSELPGNLFETVCAFLNRDGGVIVLGAQDDGYIKDGVNPRAIEQMCKNIANVSNNAEMLKPSFLLQPEIVEIEDSFSGDKRQVIVVQVPSSSQAHRFKNRYFDRSVDGDYELRTDAEISALYLRKSSEYTEDRIFPYLRIEDLSEQTIQRARDRMKYLRENHPWAPLPLMDMFKQANLYRRDPVTNQEGFTLAALMLFGKQEVIQSALPYYRIDAVVRLRNVGRYDDRLELFGNIIDSYSELMHFVEKHLPDPFYMEGDVRVSLRDKVFREIFPNMLVHREYLNPVESIMEINRDGIVIKNANRPHKAGKVTLENYVRHPKNPHMANFFVQIGFGEHLGSGIRNLYRYVPLYTGKEPIIDDEDVYTVQLALPKEMELGQGLGQLGQELRQDVRQVDSQVKSLILCLSDKHLPKTKLLELGKLDKSLPKSRETLEQKCLNPAIEAGYVAMLYPDKPKSSKQKYYLTEKGKQLYYQFNK